MTTHQAAATLDVSSDHVTKLLRARRLKGKRYRKLITKIIRKGRWMWLVRQHVIAWDVDGQSVLAYRRRQRGRNS